MTRCPRIGLAANSAPLVLERVMRLIRRAVHDDVRRAYLDRIETQ
ncbi:hypothetical protein ACFX43_21220 [Nocardioides sp. YIM B13467]